MQEFVQNSVFSRRSARFDIFALGTTHLSDFQQIARAWTERSFQRESSTFCHVIFTLGAPRFSDFQQNARVCPKQRFQPEISTFCPFCTGRTTFQRLQLNALVSAHKSIPPEISRSCAGTGRTTFCHFRTWYNTFLRFSPKSTSLYKTAVTSRDQLVLSFSRRAHHFLAIFSKVLEFVQNSVFSPRLARFVIFAQGTLLFSDFKQSVRVYTE